MTEAELLDAIWQRPDDDGPRLIYADWLQERGDPRGEFIHLQCRQTRTAEAIERERALEETYASTWSAPLRELGVSTVWFRRGLPDYVAADALTFFRHGQKLLRLAPITRLGVIGEGSLDNLYALPEFARISFLSLSGVPQSNSDLRALGDSTHARGLRTLNLQRAQLSARQVFILATSENLARLEELVIGGQEIGAQGLAALARSRLRALTQVSFHHCGLVGAEWSALANCPAFANVKRFVLTGNQLGEEGVLALSRSTDLNRLERLELASHEVTDRAVIALAQWPGLRSLEKLDLSKNRVGDEGARALASSPYVEGLRELDMSGNPLGRKGARALADSPTLRSLVSLEVDRT